MSSEFRKGLEQAAAVNFDPRSDCVAGLQKLTSPFRASSPENLICHSYSRESELQIILLPRLDSPDSMSEDEGDVEPITMTASTFDIVEMDETALSQHKSLEIHGILQQIDEESDAEGEDRLQRVSPVQPIIHGKVIHSLSVTDDGYIQMKHYKISFDIIGSGKLSEVRIAFDTRDGKQYAIKIFSKTKLQKFNMLLRTSRNPIDEAYREATILQRLRHPNVIKLIELIDDPDDENIYLVLELLEHVLIEIPTNHPCTEAVAQRYFRDIVEGIAHLHSCGIVHRDLKPENLLVSKDGRVKIVDFNICVELERDENGEELPVECWHGTPAFTPPECLQPEKKHAAGRPLDMWSLGVTLFTSVVGDLPFKADLLPDLFDSILNDSVDFPASLAISRDLKDIITGLMEKNPTNRLTMEQVQEHPWLKSSPLTWTQDDSKRTQTNFSERCSWTKFSSENGSKHDSQPDSAKLRRSVSMDEEVEKLLHGYTFL